MDTEKPFYFRAIDTSRDDGSFVFCADNGEWYAVNADGEQSPSFRNGREAAQYLDAWRSDTGSAAVWLLFLPVVALFVTFAAHLAGAVAGVA